MYAVQIKKTALKELEKIPKTHYKLIRNVIDQLSDDPRPFGCKKLKGADNLYRIRVGIYRIIYSIEDDILYITGHRKDIYR